MEEGRSRRADAAGTRDEGMNALGVSYGDQGYSAGAAVGGRMRPGMDNVAFHPARSCSWALAAQRWDRLSDAIVVASC